MSLWPSGEYDETTPTMIILPDGLDPERALRILGVAAEIAQLQRDLVSSRVIEAAIEAKEQQLIEEINRT